MNKKPLTIVLLVTYAISMLIACPTPVGIPFIWMYPLGIFEPLKFDLLEFLPDTGFKTAAYVILGIAIHAVLVFLQFKTRTKKVFPIFLILFLALIALNTYGCHKTVNSVGR